MTETPRRFRWLMNTFATGVLLWTAYCIFAWATHSGIWRIAMDMMGKLQPDAPSERSVAFIAWAFGIGAMLAIAWPMSILFRPR